MNIIQHFRFQTRAPVTAEQALKECRLGTNGSGKNNKMMKDGHCQVREKRDPVGSGIGLQHPLRSHLRGILKIIVTGKTLQDKAKRHFPKMGSRMNLSRLGSS